MANKKAHIFYSGHVQGVGFRYTAQDIAVSMGLAGWVKNLRDGRVEIVVEGNEKDVKEFLDEVLKSQLGRYISNTELSWEKPAGEFDSFDIAF